MKTKIINALLILTSLLGYLEWGKSNSTYLFKEELKIITKLFTDFFSVAHPLILLPLAGQLVLLYTLFQKTVSARLTYLGIIGLGILLLLIFAIGLMNMNYKIIGSAVPFICLAIIAIVHQRNLKITKNDSPNRTEN